MVVHKCERESAFFHVQVRVDISSLPITATATHKNNSTCIAYFTGNTPILLHKCELESAFLHVQVRVENPSLPITATHKNKSPFIAHFTGNTPILAYKAWFHVRVQVSNKDPYSHKKLCTA